MFTGEVVRGRWKVEGKDVGDALDIKYGGYNANDTSNYLEDRQSGHSLVIGREEVSWNFVHASKLATFLVLATKGRAFIHTYTLFKPFNKIFCLLW